MILDKDLLDFQYQEAIRAVCTKCPEIERSGSVAKVTLSLTKGQAILVAFLVGEVYRFVVKEGISEVAIGHEEVADLVDKLTEAVKRGGW